MWETNQTCDCIGHTQGEMELVFIMLKVVCVHTKLKAEI